ncbi:MAG: sugar ABC transporter ATP-binding protein [Gemmataceae bacterium]|nr:sugar ABC transporter ATP-binding protein [Gemmataceae bacterium]
MPAVDPPTLLRAESLTKRFPGVTALDQVSLTLRRGEVLAVIGENGAGKSTLMKILAGVERPDSGGIFLDGRPVEINTVHTALDLGIALIHQELNLAENLDVGANIFLGREPRRWGFVDFRAIERQARHYMGLVGLDVSPRALVERLSIGRRQLVEIAKALAVNARIVIMDEPTSSLSEHETELLFGVIRALRGRGISVVYISHRLREVQALADRVTVLRDGRNAGELAGADIRPGRMVSLMVGRDVSLFAGLHARTPGPTRLEVRDLVVPAHPGHPLTFSVRRGELVGIAGLVGAGRSELLQALFGIDPPLSGEVRIDGQPIRVRRPLDALRAGMGLVPEDRKEQGLILEMSIRHNISLAALARNPRGIGLLNHERERREADEMIRKLRIRTPSATQPAQNLSGGNQQKTVLAKWLQLGPRVLLLDEPTRGVDVGAKDEIYHLIEQTAAAGTAVLFASSELPEVLGLADRILVLHEGRLTGAVSRDEADEETVMHLATGRVEHARGS